MNNEYRDQKGHFTNEENDGGKCHHNIAYNSRDNGIKKLAEKIAKRKIVKIKQLPKLEGEYRTIEQISDMTGFGLDYSGKVYKALKTYTKDGYSRIRQNPKSEEATLIENFIDKHPKYDGTIYRGVGFKNKEGKSRLQQLTNFFKTGNTIDMSGISSWSSEYSVAKDFADNRNKTEDSYRFIFSVNNQSGVGIDHISEWFGENEVIQSSKIKYKILNIEQKESGKSPLYEIQLKESM